MYISKYKRRKINHWIIALIIIGIIVFTANFFISKYNHDSNAVRAMNKTELHYDADGPFIMINVKDHLIGFYNGTMPIAHYKYDAYVDEGIYDVVYDEDTEQFVLKSRSGNEIGYINPKRNIELINIFDNSVALVYNKNF